MLAVNKADGDHRIEAQKAARQLAGALRMMHRNDEGWEPPVLACSALEEWQLDEVWDRVEAHRLHLERHGALHARRLAQDVAWMWAMVDDQLLRRFHDAPATIRLAGELELALGKGTITPAEAAERLLGSSTGS